MKFRAACIQSNAVDSVEENIRRIEPLLRDAANQGGRLLALPENAFLMATGENFHSQVYTEDAHPAIKACREWAQEMGVWLLVGSVAVKPRHPAGGKAAAHDLDSAQSLCDSQNDKYYNRSYLLAPTGVIAARYDKIHLFDVAIPGGESHKESDRFEHGREAVIAQTPIGNIGLSVCYDVRFPQLYRALAKAGAEILTVPAAFTRYTGEKGGWHVLNRARAMETGCFVIAPAQCGEHAGSRKTYGHSLILNPWGEILAEGGTEPGIISAEIDLAQVAQTRQAMPSLSHDREFTVETVIP